MKELHPVISNGTTGMTLLERQRASLTRQHSNQTQQNYVMENQRIESHEMPLFNSLILGGSVIPNQTIKIDQCFNHNSSNFRDFRLTGADFAGDRVSFTPEIATSSVDVVRSLNSSCSPTTVTAPATESTDSLTGRVRLKKRKAEFSVVEDCKDNMIQRESGDWESEVTAKSNRETSASTSKENSKDQKPDYIHVRARRGQATDSHSLAERARREKISKKMKCLQDLVPGCNKVTGKAGMLEEIINYVQSLQKQVEFLSMKLATSNPRLDFNIDGFLLKELTAASHSEMANLAYLQFNQEQQEGISTCGTDMLINCTQMAPQRIASTSMPFPEAYLDSSCFPQVQSLPAWESDLQSLYKTEFH